MSCRIPRIALGARNARIAFLFRERNAAGKLVPIDLTGATAQAFFRKPSGAVVSVALTLDAPPSLGIAYYLTADGFLDEAGTWEAQGQLYLDGYFPSEIIELEVVPQLRPFFPDETLEVEGVVLELELPDPVIL